MLKQVQAISLNGISEWNAMRADENKVNEVLNAYNNSFLFVQNYANAQAIHFYLSLDENGALNMLSIDAAEDTADSQTFPEIITFEGESFPEPLDEENAISYSEASSWVNNWLDEDTRQNWINKNIGFNGGVFLAFTIDASDFMFNCTHRVFLALRAVNNNQNYVPDLVVYNLDTNQITSYLERGKSVTGNAEGYYDDFAAPVPPFKPNTRTAFQNFGLLQRLGIPTSKENSSLY